MKNKKLAITEHHPSVNSNVTSHFADHNALDVIELSYDISIRPRQREDRSANITVKMKENTMLAPQPTHQ